MSLSQSFGNAIRNRIMGGLFAVSAGVVVVNEGTSLEAYKDSAGVWTICHGETAGVRAGDTATPAECDKQLRKSLEQHSTALDGLPADTKDVALMGSLDLAYNIGVYGFRDSTVKRLLMQGDYAGAGKAVLMWRFISKTSKHSPGKGWVYKGGKRWTFDCSQYLDGKPNKVCYGLWKRRQWQASAISGQFKTPEEALAALQASKR